MIHVIDVIKRQYMVIWFVLVLASSMMMFGAVVAQQGGPQSVLVQMDRVIVEPLQQTFPVIGRLVTQRQGSVAVRISGPVAAVLVDIGDRVTQGGVLARLDQTIPELQVAFQRAELQGAEAFLDVQEANLALAQQTLSRLEGLRGSSSFSRARYDDAQKEVTRIQASLAEAQAQLVGKQVLLAQAQVDLDNTLIKAPYDGIVIAKHTEIGAYLLTGAAVVTLIDVEKIEIEAEVPTDRLLGLVAGTRITIRLDDGSEHHATVRVQVPNEDPHTRTRTVRFTPQWGQLSKPLAINQAVTLSLPISHPRSVISVHKDAVISNPQGSIVFIVEEDIAQIRPILLGEAVGGRFEVLSGLQEDDLVVIRGNERLLPGQRVRDSEE